MEESEKDWLGDLLWQGYPRMLAPEPSAAPIITPTTQAPTPPPVADPRLDELTRENATLRARLDELLKMANEFQRRLSEAGKGYEAAILEAESRIRDAALEKERLSGELEAAKSECTRLNIREATHEADIKLERERRFDLEKNLSDTRRRLEEITGEAERLRGMHAEQMGTISELRRQMSNQSDNLSRAKSITEQDVLLLKSKLNELMLRLQNSPQQKNQNP